MMLGEQLKNYMPNKGDQKARACDWLDRWGPQEGRKPSVETVISNLSRCVNDNVEGVRFFFDEEPKAHRLLDVLGVADGERSRVLEAAKSLICGTRRPARLAVDLCSWPCEGDAATQLFQAFKRAFLEPSPQPFPLVVFVTEEQYDRLPRSFDDYEESLRVERCKNGPPDAAEIARRAGDVVIASRRRLAPYERWIACERSADGLVMEPPEGPQILAREGRLPRLPAPAHVIPDDVAALDRVPPFPANPLELRRLMGALVVEEEALKLGQPREIRRAWAQALGVQAASTPRERIEDEILAALRATQVTPSSATPEVLARLLARAARRPVESSALRVGDQLHLVNPTEETAAAAASHRCVRIHRYVPKPPALMRVIEDLRARPWSYDDILDDPFLAAYTREVVAEVSDPLDAAIVEHAVATLSLDGAVNGTKAPEPIDDWQKALRRLVQRDPPPAWVLLRACKREIREARGGGRALWPRLFWAPRKLVERVNEGVSVFERGRISIGDLLLQRDDAILVEVETESHGEQAARFKEGAAAHVDTWLHLVEHSPICGGPAKRKRDSWEPQDEPCPKNWTPLREAKFDWPALDREIGAAWLLLRRALCSPNAVRLHDGTVLLHVGPVLVAEITLRAARPRKRREAPIAALFAELVEAREGHGRNNAFTVQHTQELVTGRTVTSSLQTTSRVTAPRGLYLSDDEAIAEIRLAVSPLLGDITASLAANASAASEAIQAGQRSHDD